jgi:Trypsin
MDPLPIILQLLHVLLNLWEFALVDHVNWDAYGFRAEKMDTEVPLRAAVFVRSQAAGEALIERLRAELSLLPPEVLNRLFEIVIMPRPFLGTRTGIKFRKSVMGRPGARVFTTSARCGRGCFGTIGGFLKQAGAPATDPVWLLTNHHILAEHEECVRNSQVRGSGGRLLSTQVRFVPLQENKPNQADVAIARIRDPKTISGEYPGISITCPSPARPRDKMQVQKLGNATNVTTGIALWYCPRVVSVSCSGKTFEFEDQIVIGSKSKKEPFLAHGDSGSLVIGDRHPIGLLHAIGSKVTLPSGIQAVAPLGLASPFGTVLKELNDKTRLGPLQLVLDSSPTDCGKHTERKDDGCIAYLQEIFGERIQMNKGLPPA